METPLDFATDPHRSACRRRGLSRWAVALLAAAALPAQHTWPLWMHSVVPDAGVPQPATVLGSQLAATDGAIYAFWHVDDPTNPMLWSRSLDHGRSWTPLAAFRPGSSPAGGAPLHLFANGTDVLVQWDEWSVSGHRSLLAVSSDRGASWTVRPGPLHVAPTNLLDQGGTILWSSGPWLFSSVDRGVSWQGPRAIGGVGTNLGVAENVQLRLQDGVLHAAWDEFAGSSSQAYYARSTDLGVTWQPAARALGAASGTTRFANLIVAPGAVCLVWNDAAGYVVDRSLDAGATWLPAPGAVASLPAAVSPTFASDGQSLVAVWQENQVAGTYRARCVRSPDLGRTWTAPATDVLTVQGAGRYVGITDLHSDGGWLAVTVRNQNRNWFPYTLDFHRVASKDGGATWWGAGGTIVSGCESAPRFATSGGLLCGLWQNELPTGGVGYGDLRFDWFAGPRPLGGATPGTGGVAPVLSVDEVPAYGFDSDLTLRRGLPGAPAILSFGTPRAPVPFLGGQLVLDPVAYLFATLGTQTSSNPGGVDQAVRLLPGMPAEFCWQAFVLDPGAVGGVAMSAGIEVRVY